MSKWLNLLKSLRIETEIANKQNIDKLEQWYYQNISQQPLFNTITTSDRKLIILKQEINHFLETVYEIPPEKCGETFAHLDDLNAIQYASKYGFDLYLVNRLAANKSALNTPTSGQLTPLHLAAYYGHEYAAKAILENGAKYNLKTRLQQTPAHLALNFPPSVSREMKPKLMERKISIFNELLKHNENTMMAIDNSDNTMAHFAAENGFISILEEISKHYGQLLKLKNSSSHTPLHESILKHQQDSIDCLIGYEELLSIPDKNQRLPIHYAALYGDVSTLSKFATHPYLDSKDINQKTPLILAAQQGNLENVKLLIDKGADITLKDQYGRDMLQYAVISQNLALIEWLVLNVKDININLQDNSGKTGLMNLIVDANNDESDVSEIVRYLIKAGSDPSLVDNRGVSLRDYLKSGAHDLTQYLELKLH